MNEIDRISVNWLELKSNNSQYDMLISVNVLNLNKLEYLSSKNIIGVNCGFEEFILGYEQWFIANNKSYFWIRATSANISLKILYVLAVK